MATQIQLRRDTAANWTSSNPILTQGEFGYETDTAKFKIGDGTTAWNSLSYHTHSHTLLSDIGTNTHAQIDTAVTASTNHIADSSDPHGTTLTQTTLDVTTLKIATVSVTSSAAELNILDGVTSTATELNKVDGYTGSAADLNTAVAHAADNTQAHSDYLLNDTADIGVALTLTGDNASVDTAYVPMVLYNTDATPPTASTFPIGTIYIQYTA